MKHLEKLANIAIIIGVAVFLFVVARNHFTPTAVIGTQQSQPDASAKALVGKTIAIPGVLYPLAHNTLILAISKTCHYCKESQPFYRKLAAAAGGRFDLVAVLPQAKDEAKEYLQESSVPVKQVVSVNLDSIGVHATPTLLLVNASGLVKEAWVGLLDDESQTKVLTAASN